MTANIQISKKTADGTILVLGGDTFDEFQDLVLDSCSSASFEHIIGLFADFAETGVTAVVPKEQKVRIGETPQSYDPLRRSY